MTGARKIIKPIVWAFYFAIVLEFLFMISPLALYFYSGYTPLLNALRQWQYTAWLTQFYLPHFSQTTSELLNILNPISFFLLGAGLLLFLGAAIPIYAAKLLRRGAVTGGLYRWCRHPQYTAFIVMGLGTTLIWPRFIVLLGFVSMFFVYLVLARWEEQECLKQFGDSYREYCQKTGMFLPRFFIFQPSKISAFDRRRIFVLSAAWLVTLAVAIGCALFVREYSFSHISAVFDQDFVVLSPANMEGEHLNSIYQIAISDEDVRSQLNESGENGGMLIYVVPQDWYLPDLPIKPITGSGGHQTPSDFDPSRFYVLFNRIRTFSRVVKGRDILRKAHGREAILLASIDATNKNVTDTEVPQPYILGDFPGPLF